uniref:UFSP1/2/DUB catalytic domain-containing protein n=1 Tax=Meloidogyne javanica TaxID=6303 RepID=A0A915NAA5_MELJA
MSTPNDLEEFPTLIYNPHENLTVQSKNKCAIVSGEYGYFHYGQNSFDDSGWGCAYRSFQTCLIDIGDKPSNFVGSKKWIGSLELSFCLQNMFNITSKILTSKSGSDLAEHARALIFHFENGGAPVMIGGGQLAHTIIGIDYNPRLGNCQYLVLDPHYTGTDNIDDILAGGWCGWKPATFWSKKDFYNLLVVINGEKICCENENGHEGCVNSIKWNDSGTLLASGSDDQHLIIWHQNGRLLRRLQTLHSNNIFSVLFVPHAHDHLLLSAAGDSLILLHELDQMSSNDLCHIQKWECKGRVKKMAICKEEPRIFWAVSEDGVLKQCDLRDNKTTDFNFSEEYGSLKSLAINESSSEMLAIGLSSALVPIYDKRNMKEPIMKLLPSHLSVNEEGHFLSTNLEFNKIGTELLLAKECLSFYQKLHPEDTSAEHIIGKISEEEDESLNWTSNDFRDYIDRFTGHLNINTDIKEASWFGGDDQFIVAGSDCGSIFIWERQTEKVVKVLKGDNFTVNCVQPHPDRCLIASSGIDKVVRFWEPSTTSLKKITEKDQIEETEDRDISKNKYDLMKKNRRRRTPEMIWEQLINSVGMGIFNVDENNQSDDDENVNNNQQQQVIHCRQM